MPEKMGGRKDGTNIMKKKVSKENFPTKGREVQKWRKKRRGRITQTK